MGIFIYAGAAQFMAVTLLANRAGIAEVFAATLLLNLRHLFYGLALMSRFSGYGWGKLYAIFGMTDETVSIVLSSQKLPEPDDKTFILGLTAINHAWWVLGCTLGALLRTSIKFDATGLEFSLTALFVVLLLEQWLKNRDIFPIFAGVAAGAITILLHAESHFLLISIGFAIAISAMRSKK